jgi:hypothetical protein
MWAVVGFEIGTFKPTHRPVNFPLRRTLTAQRRLIGKGFGP